MLRCRQTEGWFKRHAKSLLLGVAFDQPGSNSEALLVSEQAISLPSKRVGREIAVVRIAWILASKRQFH